MIATASDVEENSGPGTPKYHCQICKKAVTWKRAIVPHTLHVHGYAYICTCMRPSVIAAIYHGTATTVGYLTLQQAYLNRSF